MRVKTDSSHHGNSQWCQCAELFLSHQSDKTSAQSLFALLINYFSPAIQIYCGVCVCVCVYVYEWRVECMNVRGSLKNM